MSRICRCYLNERIDLSPEMALPKLEAAFGLDADMLMGMQTDHKLAQARARQAEITANIRLTSAISTLIMAVESIRHEGLRRLWEKDDPSRVPANSTDNLRRMLAAINRSSAPQKLAAADCRDGTSTH